jgi:hypothetical protein
MAVINLTPHPIQIYSEQQFINLVEENPTTFVAEKVEGEAIAEFPTEGNARISVTTTDMPSKDGIVFVKSEYGELVGIPENVGSEDILIVSLPTKSNATAAGHPLAAQMVSPFKVVRDAANTSNVLGAIGLSF